MPSYDYKIINELLDNNLTRDELAEKLNTEVANISKRIKKLKEAGIISEKEEKRSKDKKRGPGRPQKGKSGPKSNTLYINLSIKTLQRIVELLSDFTPKLLENEKVTDLIYNNTKSMAANPSPEIITELIKTNPNLLKWFLNNYEELTSERDINLVMGRVEIPFKAKWDIESFARPYLSRDKKALLGTAGIPELFFVVMWSDLERFSKSEVDEKAKEKVKEILSLAKEIHDYELQIKAKLSLLYELFGDELFGEDFYLIHPSDVDALIGEKSLAPVKSLNSLLGKLEAHHMKLGKFGIILAEFIEKKKKGESVSLRELLEPEAEEEIKKRVKRRFLDYNIKKFIMKKRDTYQKLVR